MDVETYLSKLEAVSPDVCASFREGTHVEVRGTQGLGELLFTWHLKLRELQGHGLPLIPEVEVVVEHPDYKERRQCITGIGSKSLMFSMGIYGRELYSVYTPFTTTDYLELEQIAQSYPLYLRMATKKIGNLFKVPLKISSTIPARAPMAGVSIQDMAKGGGKRGAGVLAAFDRPPGPSILLRILG